MNSCHYSSSNPRTNDMTQLQIGTNLCVHVSTLSLTGRHTVSYKQVAQLYYLSKCPHPCKTHLLRSLDILYSCIQFADLSRFLHSTYIFFKVNVPYVENLLTPNISYPKTSDSSAHTTQETGNAAMILVFLDYFY